MDDLPADLREFLQNQPFLELTEAKKIKCTLNGHEFPCKLAEIQSFISGKKYKKLCAGKEFNYSQYEPYLVPSTKQQNHLFCKLTLRHLNRVPHHVLRHVSGKRFKKALAQYEECVKQGVEFVPLRLQQKKSRPKNTEDGMESRSEDSGKHKQKQKVKKKQDSGIWAPSSSEGEASDSEDSMSDLYPPTLFTLKKPEGQEEIEGDEDEFQTDDDEEEDMEVSEPEEAKQAVQKRKKVQSAGVNKKFKKNKKRKGFKQISKVKNGK
ncbi:surfeit locus protein 2 [Tachysurus fulvidraco]|uniref:surfeit locus protein 2 n=1 Tax=Tachysurus fulvidraco TaxID=1234273 RepID=UPI000F512F88|nr:surfeit locus protein 2 [Tachysurus fulvidraco]